MKACLADLNAFVSVARAGGFRDGARASGVSASGLSEAVRRLEAQLGVRLLNRTTRSVVATEAGERLLERLTRRRCARSKPPSTWPTACATGRRVRSS